MSLNSLAIQGWIPRSGLQYGTHLVLYEQHPSQVHSAACVLIVPTDPGEQPPLASKAQTPDGHNGSLSWHNVEGINRLCTRVGAQPACHATLGIE